MAENHSRRFLTVPNMLSLSRLALLPVWWVLMRSPDRTLWWWGGALILYGMVSDILDGWIARRFHQATDWGRILDPVGDKAASATVAVFCVVHRGLPLEALLLTLGRDALIVVAAVALYRRAGIVSQSMNLGRYAALFWGVTLFLFAFDLQPYGGWMLWPTVAFYLLAGLAYLVKGIRNSALHRSKP